MSKSRYYALKAMGRCTVCGKNPADGTSTMCLMCRMERRNKREKRSTESAYHSKYWHKRRRDLWYAFGVCVVCGKRDAKSGSSMCGICLEKARKREQEKRIKGGKIPRIIFGDGYHCGICGSEISVSDKKLCENCYPKYRELMLYARSCKTEKNYFEKQNEAWWNIKNADKRN